MLLWSLLNPRRLSPRSRRTLERQPISISVVSYWELVLKSSHRAAPIPDPVSWWKAHVRDSGWSILSIDPAHVTAPTSLPAIHRDPFDRMLAAQTRAEALTLVTADETLAACGVPTLW